MKKTYKKIIKIKWKNIAKLLIGVVALVLLIQLIIWIGNDNRKSVDECVKSGLNIDYCLNQLVG